MRRFVIRAAAAAALGAPLLMWSEFLIVGLATPRFNLLTRAASDLGATGAPYAGVFDAGFFVVAGLLTVLFAAGLLAATGRSAWWTLGALLVVAEGGLLVAAGLNSEDPASPALTARHQLLASLCFGSAGVAPGALLLGKRITSTKWRATSVAVLLIEAAGVVTSRFWTYPDGLFQRPFGVALTFWFVAGAVWLWRAAERVGTGQVRHARPRVLDTSTGV